MTPVLVAAGVAAAALAGLRWLRVAQREHYLAGSATRFAGRWWTLGANRWLALAGLAGVVAAVAWPPAAVVAAGVAAVGPLGLSLKGRTSPLAWTRRLRTVAGVWAALTAVGVVAGAALGAGAAVTAAVAVLAPVVVDAALAVTAPVERRLAERFVEAAAARLAAVRPTVVAITGSYGKTTTKGYVAHLAAGARSVVATPASFNNRAGLARAVNEHLTPGTEVFVAEMGTYGPGEIAELCRWCPPDVAVITAIGPVHLERMKTEETIARAKAEILEGAEVAVLNVDHPLLAGLAGERAGAGQKVVRCSGIDPQVGVNAVNGEVRMADRVIGRVDGDDHHPGNVACAVAAVLALGVPESVVAARLAGLPVAAHRREVSTGASGATVIDDTYNANPAGAAGALAALARLSQPGHRAVVVTPGMVELGRRQHEENARFAAAATTAASHLVVVGHTNRPALLEGAAGGTAEVVTVPTREQAVAWVREHVGPGDVVLYENDLPDHHP